MTPAEARRRCRAIGARRKRLAKAEERLSEDTTRALRTARGVLPVKEAATLAGITRSTAYDVYLKR